MIDPDSLAQSFASIFGRPARLYRAPGRVNLIGEHTDYNDGFVMPMAIDRATWVAAAPRADGRVVARSPQFDDAAATFDLDRLLPHPSRHWSDYVRGVTATVRELAPSFRGADFLIGSDVPVGAGLSSSAALEVSIGCAIADLGGARVALVDLARACQRAEHLYVGTRCGIMDQMIACLGRAGYVMKLDTRSLDVEWLPLPSNVKVLVCNTMVAHELASAEYNVRRADCEAGVAALRRRFPAVRALRDADLSMLDAIAGSVSPTVLRRCRHVVTENTRVGLAAAALSVGDYAQFGRLMAESHRSLRDDYEVSCHELDVMVAIVAAADGVYGARMTGGGFGGCVVALADANAVGEAMTGGIQRQYGAEVGMRPDVWVCAADAGVSGWPVGSAHATARR